jgi:hypothetical protein
MNIYFGNNKEDNCILFVIDSSITMVEEKFTLDNSNFVSRMKNVHDELIICLQNLRSYQNFNIIKFNKKCICYHFDCVPASRSNIEDAVHFINN